MNDKNTKEKKPLKKWHMQALTQKVSEALHLRGIHVPFTLDLEYSERGGAWRFTGDSDAFYTIPNILGAIHVRFYGQVKESTRTLKEGDVIDTLDVYVDVGVRYEGNGQDLFRLRGELQKRGTREGEHVFFIDPPEFGGIIRNRDYFHSFDFKD